MPLALLFHYLLLNKFRMLVHSSSGACDLLWIYFMCCIALVRCVLLLRCGSAGWCGILMYAEAVAKGDQRQVCFHRSRQRFPDFCNEASYAVYSFYCNRQRMLRVGDVTLLEN